MTMASSQVFLEQRAGLAVMGRVFWASLRRPRGRSEGAAAVPGPSESQVLPPRSRALVRAYVQTVGGDGNAYGNTLPPHFFPQWSIEVVSRTLEHTGYPIPRIINLGCSFHARTPLPADEPLCVTANLASVDDDGRRAVVTTRIVTSTESAPEAHVAEMVNMFPLRRSPEQEPRRAREQPAVPGDAVEIGAIVLDRHAGLRFAKLTGDFNPIHWLSPAARIAGFPRCIMHGYGTIAYALEQLRRGPLAGEPSALKGFRCRLLKPLLLPASTRVYVRGDELFVADAPEAPVYLQGRFET